MAHLVIISCMLPETAQDASQVRLESLSNVVCLRAGAFRSFAQPVAS